MRRFQKSENIIFIAFFSLAVLKPAAPAVGAPQYESLSAAKKALNDGFYELSLNLFTEFLQAHPGSEDVLEAEFNIGLCYLNLKRYQQAIDIFQRLINTNGAKQLKDRLYYWLAEAYFKNKDSESAYNNFKALTDEFPGSYYQPQALYSLGWCRFESKDFNEALRLFSDFKEKHPGHQLVYEVDLKIAECLYALKNYKSLRAHLEEIFLKSSNGQEAAQGRNDTLPPFISFYLAESCFYLGDYKCAIENYSIVRGQNNPQDMKSAICLGLGWSYFKSADYGGAIANFNLLLENQADSKMIENALLGKALSFYGDNSYAQSIKVFDQLLALTNDPEARIEAYIEKAQVLADNNDLPSAIRCYRESEKLIDNSTAGRLIYRTRYGLGLIYQRLADYEEALNSFNLSLSYAADQRQKVSVLLKIAEIKQATGKDVQALEIYENIIRDFPGSQGSDYAFYNSGLFLYNQKKYEKAIEKFNSLVKDHPDSNLVYDSIFYAGLSYYENGDFLNSYMKLRNLRGIDPKENSVKLEAVFLEGLSLKAMRQYENAYSIFKDLIRETPANHQLLPRLEYEAAECLYYSGETKGALERLEFLRTKYPQMEISELILWRLAEHFFYADDFEKSKRYLTSIINQGADAVIKGNAYNLLGECYEAEGKHKDSIEAYLKIQDPGKGVLLKIARGYRKLNDINSSAEFYKKVLESNDYADLEPVQFELAELLEEADRIDEAVNGYLSVKNDPNLRLKGLLRAAKMYEAIEELPKAIKIYQEIAGLDTAESRFAAERAEALSDSSKHSVKER